MSEAWGYFWCLTRFWEGKAVQSGVPAACLLDVWCFSVLHCPPFAGCALGAPCRYVDPRSGVGWVCATLLLLSSPSPARSSLGAHLVSSKSVLVKVSACSGITWLWAEQSLKSNPPSGGHRGGREQTPRSGRGRRLQATPWTGKVQYSHPLLCTDPRVALGGWVWV